MEPTHPHEILEEAAATLKQRGVDYDGKGYQGGERSMAQTVAIFRAFSGIELSELDGWRFLICLKLARSTTGKSKRDTYVDLAGYAGLAAEAAIDAQAVVPVNEITERELRELCGYVEDGSHVTISIGQDDATKDWVVTINKKQYYGKSMREALRNAGQIKGD